MIIILMGVTGSGKTTVGEMLADELGWRFYDGDDFHAEANVEKMRQGISLTDSDRLPWLMGLRDLIKEGIEKRQNTVIACSALRKSYQDMLLMDTDAVRLVYLKGGIELIKKRLEDRTGHFMNKALLLKQFAILEEPENAVYIDISESPENIVASIRKHLGV